MSKSKGGPWGKQVYFGDDEFEIMMDCLREKCGEGNFQEGSGVDVDLVLLRAFQIEPDFVVLPPGLLGRTKFFPDGRAIIDVSRDLADAAEEDVIARRRLRTTLAHEAGHVCCHRDLFLRDTATLSLFNTPDDQSLRSTILCREEAVGHWHYNGEWWEYQANRCMAALLLPKQLLKEKVVNQLTRYQVPSFTEAIKADKAAALIRDLSNIFDVSFEATLYRLKDFGFIPSDVQMGLELP
jgi:hypothetical protein